VDKIPKGKLKLIASTISDLADERWLGILGAVVRESSKLSKKKQRVILILELMVFVKKFDSLYNPLKTLK